MNKDPKVSSGSDDLREARGAMVLCGGRSRRMGSDKASLKFGESTLLNHVCRQLLEITSQVVVVAAPLQLLPSLPAHVAVVRDAVEARGPLVAMAGAADALPARVESFYLTGCDYPFIQRQVVHRLFEMVERDADVDAAVVRHQGRLEPLVGVYSLRMAAIAKRAVAQGTSSLRSLLESARIGILDDQELRRLDPRLRSVTNVNTPSQLAESETAWPDSRELE